MPTTELAPCCKCIILFNYYIAKSLIYYVPKSSFVRTRGVQIVLRRALGRDGRTFAHEIMNDALQCRSFIFLYTEWSFYLLLYDVSMSATVI